MSYLSDIFAFEKENLADMWRKVKKDPERLFIGAADPWSSKMWGKITGKDYEPIVDQMGGAYGGHTISAFGNTDGGVYQRARDKGIDTGPGGNAQDLAHVVAAMYAGNYGLGKLGNMGGQSGNNSWQQFSPPSSNQAETSEAPPRASLVSPVTDPAFLQQTVDPRQRALAVALQRRA